MSAPILYKLSEASRTPKTPFNSPLPMHLTIEETTDQLARRLFEKYTTENTLPFLRELTNGDILRKKIITFLTESKRYTEALELAIEIKDIRERDIELNKLVTPFVELDACPELNRLASSLSLEKKEACKFRIGTNYADRGNFIRVIETYFFMERMAWRNNLFLAVFKKVPDEQKASFLDFIITKFLDKNEVENAVEAVKKCHAIDKQVAYHAMAHYLFLQQKLDQIGFILNELNGPIRLQILDFILNPLLSSEQVERAVEITKPLKDREDILFYMGIYIINNKLSGLAAITSAMTYRRDELIKLIPTEPMAS